MVSLPQVRTIAIVSLITMVASSRYFLVALESQWNNVPLRWFCNPVASNSVTGPGMGNIVWYAHAPRSPLGYEDCRQLAVQLDLAQAYSGR